MSSAIEVRRENFLKKSEELIERDPFAFADVRNTEDKPVLIGKISNGNKIAELSVQTYDEGFAIRTSPQGGRFAPELRAPVALKLMAINCKLRRGLFVVDPVDGELSFKHFVPCYDDMSVSEKCLWTELTLGVRMLSAYMDDILKDLPEENESEFVINEEGAC